MKSHLDEHGPRSMLLGLMTEVRYGRVDTGDAAALIMYMFSSQEMVAMPRDPGPMLVEAMKNWVYHGKARTGMQESEIYTLAVEAVHGPRKAL